MITLTDEEVKFVEERLTEHFRTLKMDYLRCVSVKDLRVVQDILRKYVDKNYRINSTCLQCQVKAIRKIYELYQDTISLREAEQTKPVKTRKKRKNVDSE